MGGTGIVGVITGFASVCVNGVEVHYDSKTPVSVNGQTASARDLAVGQLVVVHASTVNGQLRANGIGTLDAVRGTVTSVNPAGREIQVMGQTVRMDSAGGAGIATIQPGAAVRVSGLRMDSGVIIASRVDTVPASAGASMLGTVSSVNGNIAVINGTRVTLSSIASLPLVMGSEVFVAGTWNGAALQAGRVESQPVQNAIARSDRAIVEGFVTQQRGNQLSIGSVAVQLSEGVNITGGTDRDAAVGRKVQIEIRRVGDAWLADRVILQRPEITRSDGAQGSQMQRGNQDAGQNNGANAQDSTGRDNAGNHNNVGSSESGTSSSGGSGSSGSGSSGSSSGSSGSSGSGSSGSGSSGSGSSGSGSSSAGSGSSGGSSSGSSTSSGPGSGGSKGSTSSGSATSGSSGSGSSRSGSSGSSGSGRSGGSGNTSRDIRR
jgi:hypothetical protein